MSIGAITGIGKQNVESGGGSLFRVTMRGYARINSSSYEVNCYAIVNRFVTSINDMTDYILGGPNKTGTAYYPCYGRLISPNTALSIFNHVSGFRASRGDPGALSLKGVLVYGSNNQTSLNVNVTEFYCSEM